MDADVLPVDAQTTASAPRPTATDNATVIPRSLKEPVGLSPSTLIHTSAPVSSDSHGLSTSGVPPSLSVWVGVPSGSGNQSRYSSITPRHCRVVGAPTVTRPLPRPASPRTRHGPRASAAAP